MRKPKSATVLAAMVLALVSAGCKSDATAPRVDPVGSWSGSTSQALPFSFQVTSAGLTTVAMSYRLTGTRCSVDAQMSVSGPALPITNDALTINSLSLGPGTTLNASGVFMSSSAASGTFQISDTSCGGSTNGTWTATKH